MRKVNTTSGALRVAKRYLWDGTGGWDRYIHDPVMRVYICDSIRKAYYDERITQKAMSTATALIMGRLGPHASVGRWLEANVGYRVNQGHNAYHKQVQAYRHRWLDALIKEFEKKGD